MPPQTAPPAWRGRLVRLLPAAAAALSGLLLYVSFPPRTLWWLAVPAFAVFGWVLRGRSWKAALGLGYLFGLGFLLPLLVWTGVEVGPGPWLALVVIEAVFVALVGAGIAAVSRLPGRPVWAAALWIAGEAGTEAGRLRTSVRAVSRRCGPPPWTGGGGRRGTGRR